MRILFRKGLFAAMLEAVFQARKLFLQVAWLAALACGPSLAAQVQTNVPPPVAGARPVAVERIKVHSSAIEGKMSSNSQ